MKFELELSEERAKDFVKAYRESLDWTTGKKIANQLAEQLFRQKEVEELAVELYRKTFAPDSPDANPSYLEAWKRLARWLLDNYEKKGERRK